MTAPTTVDNEPSGPIPDDLLADALTARAMANETLDLGEPDATPVPAAETVTEGTTADKPADAPEALDAPAAPTTDEGPEATATAPDPFAEMMKDGKPLAYTVNRESRTFDGILEIEGKGALIPADKLAEVRDRLAREESNAAYTKELHADVQRYEQAFGGYDKMVERLETTTRINAASMHIMDVLSKAKDANGNISMDAYNYGLLVKEAIIKSNEAVWEFRAEQTQRQQDHATTQQDAAVAENTVPQAMAALKAKYPTLTDEDWQEFAETYGPIKDSLRFKATPEDAQRYGVKPGAWLIDMPKMEPFAAKRSALRATLATTNTAVKAAEKFNAAATPKPVAAKPKPKAVPRDADGKFVERERINPSDAFERSLAGRSIATGQPFDDD